MVEWYGRLGRTGRHCQTKNRPTIERVKSQLDHMPDDSRRHTKSCVLLIVGDYMWDCNGSLNMDFVRR